MKHVSGTIVLAAVALIAIAAWPFFNAHRPAAASPYVAPVLDDYDMRDRTIAFYETRIRRDSSDQISARILAAEYMQRYRESQDIGDVLRSIHEAQRSLALQPQNNASASEVLASGYTALHLFTTALRYDEAAAADQPDDSNAPAQIASTDMELGRYTEAKRELAIAERIRDTPTVMAVRARYDELTGSLAEARELLREAIAQTDAIVDNSAQGRAWYHFRAGELAFSSGAVDEAKDQEQEALTQFPHFEMAYRALARFCWATKDWTCALDAATKGAAVIPEPEVLGYEADAQRALGRIDDARRTQALIFAVERLGNAYHVNDRLLAVFYSEHGLRPADALDIAEREVRSRGNEVYAQDTLAWAAATAGRWDVARSAAARATRFGTQDPRIEFHAGMIALHFGDLARGRALLEKALAANPQFDPFYADEARTILARDR